MIGLSISTITFLFGCYSLIDALTCKFSEPGISSLIISTIGIIGIYLGKTHNQIKIKPINSIDEKIEN